MHAPRPYVTAALVAALGVLLVLVVPARADTDDCWAIGWRCHTVNAYRAEQGRTPLDQTQALQDSAGAWARQMAASGVLDHSPAAGTDYAEIVGVAPDWTTMLAAWDQSPEHRAILLAHLGRVGIGCDRVGDLLFCAVQFGY